MSVMLAHGFNRGKNTYVSCDQIYLNLTKLIYFFWRDKNHPCIFSGEFLAGGENSIIVTFGRRLCHQAAKQIGKTSTCNLPDHK